MSWWFSFKNLYGLLMGTSTDFMTISKRPHWPVHWVSVSEDFSIYLGGTGNCGFLRNKNKVLLINCNSGESSKAFFDHIQEGDQVSLLGTSLMPDQIGGLRELHWDQIYLPSPSRDRKKVPIEEQCREIHWVEKDMEISWGDEVLSITRHDNIFEHPLLSVALKNHQYLFTGPMALNQIHPYLDENMKVGAKVWIDHLERMIIRCEGKVNWVVPNEGDVDNLEILSQFKAYLVTLANPKIEFSFCRKNYDWHEIPGYSSLEDNFDVLRSNS